MLFRSVSQSRYAVLKYEVPFFDINIVDLVWQFKIYVGLPLNDEVVEEFITTNATSIWLVKYELNDENPEYTTEIAMTNTLNKYGFSNYSVIDALGNHLIEESCDETTIIVEVEWTGYCDESVIIEVPNDDLSIYLNDLKFDFTWDFYKMYWKPELRTRKNALACFLVPLTLATCLWCSFIYEFRRVVHKYKPKFKFVGPIELRHPDMRPDSLRIGDFKHDPHYTNVQYSRYRPHFVRRRRVHTLYDWFKLSCDYYQCIFKGGELVHYEEYDRKVS